MSRLVSVGNPPIQVKLRRSGRSRRLSLRISRTTGDVTLTLPNSVPEQEGIDFLHEKELWLRQHLVSMSPVVPVRIGDELPFRGDMLPVSPGTGRGVSVSDAGFLVPGDPDRVGVRLQSFLKTTARDHLAVASDRYAKLVGRSVGRITLRDTKSRWGSCTSRGDLMYSWRLIMAPPEVLDYVAAHEVAHLVEMNHSDAFWQVVDQIFPDHRRCREWLRHHGGKLHRYDFGN